MKKKYYIFEMDSKILNTISVIFFAIIIILSYLINKELLITSFNINNYVVLLLLLLGYLCLHEFLHSIAYVIYGAKYKNITYGIALEKGVMYCLCKQNITKRNILHSLLYPLFFIGIVTYVIALIYNIPMLFLLSIINIAGSIGDLIMFKFIYKLEDVEFSEFDSILGFALYSKNDLSKEKPYGINFIEKVDKLERKDKKKITISKQSITLLIIFFALAIISVII